MIRMEKKRKRCAVYLALLLTVCLLSSLCSPALVLAGNEEYMLEPGTYAQEGMGDGQEIPYNEEIEAGQERAAQEEEAVPAVSYNEEIDGKVPMPYLILKTLYSWGEAIDPDILYGHTDGQQFSCQPRGSDEELEDKDIQQQRLDISFDGEVYENQYGVTNAFWSPAYIFTVPDYYNGGLGWSNCSMYDWNHDWVWNADGSRLLYADQKLSNMFSKGALYLKEEKDGVYVECASGGKDNNVPTDFKPDTFNVSISADSMEKVFYYGPQRVKLEYAWSEQEKVAAMEANDRKYEMTIVRSPHLQSLAVDRELVDVDPQKRMPVKYEGMWNEQAIYMDRSFDFSCSANVVEGVQSVEISAEAVCEGYDITVDGQPLNEDGKAAVSINWNADGYQDVAIKLTNPKSQVEATESLPGSPAKSNTYTLRLSKVELGADGTPVIVGQPQGSGTYLDTDDVTLSMEAWAKEGAEIAYQWQVKWEGEKEFQDIQGDDAKKASYAIPKNSTSASVNRLTDEEQYFMEEGTREYQCVASNAGDPDKKVTSDPVRISVILNPKVYTKLSVIDKNGNPVTVPEDGLEVGTWDDLGGPSEDYFLRLEYYTRLPGAENLEMLDKEFRMYSDSFDYKFADQKDGYISIRLGNNGVDTRVQTVEVQLRRSGSLASQYGQYDDRIDNKSNGIKIKLRLKSIKEKLRFKTQPSSWAFPVGETPNKNLVAELDTTNYSYRGFTVEYQWYSRKKGEDNWNKLDGKTSEVLSLPAADKPMTVEYKCSARAKKAYEEDGYIVRSDWEDSIVATIKYMDGTEWESGDGSENNPYQIWTIKDLERVREDVNTGINSYKGKYLKLMQDIDVPGNWADGKLIGTLKKREEGQLKATYNAFSGTLDGDGHRITIPKGGQTLFGFCREAVFRNLDIYGEEIDGSALVNYYGIDYGDDLYYATADDPKFIFRAENVTLKAGTHTSKSGLVDGVASGINYVFIDNCKAEKGVVVGTPESGGVGTFVGALTGTITNCTSEATVQGKSWLGGIAGEKCQSMGYCSIENCTFNGEIHATGNLAGGILAGGYYDPKTAPNTPCVNIRNCCVGKDAVIEAANYAGGILGFEPAIQAWDNGKGRIENNCFYGQIKCTGAYKGGILARIKGLNKNNIIANNYYLAGCGAEKGIGRVQAVDTSVDNPTAVDGVYYYDTTTDLNEKDDKGIEEFLKPVNDALTSEDIPWPNICKINHNRTDDPLGRDAANLAAAMGVTAFTDGTVLAKLNAGDNDGTWKAAEDGYPVLTGSAALASSLQVTGGKQEYTVGEAFTKEGMEFAVLNSDGTSRKLSPEEAQEVEIFGFDSSSPTVDEPLFLTVKYGDITGIFTVRIIERAPAVEVTGISLDKTSIELTAGGEATLTAKVEPENATDKQVTWKSSDETVASVDQNGKVTAKKAGTAYITAAIGDFSASCKVTVKEAEPGPGPGEDRVEVTGISLDKTSIELTVGGEETLTAKVEPENATDKQVTWKSSDETVASVDQNGKVTARKAGTAQITAEAGSFTAACAVTVKETEPGPGPGEDRVEVTGISLNKASIELTVGGEETLTAKVEPENATDKQVTWKSSDETVASVDQNGKVTARKAGTAQITAKAGSFTAACKVTVKEAEPGPGEDRVEVTGISIKDKLELSVGKTYTLTAKVKPENATDKSVSWKSSDKSIVRVDQNGKVTADKVGEAVITAQAGGKKATCKVTVKAAEKKAQGVTYDVTGKSEVTFKDTKSKAKVAIPATVKIGGKSYKVTAVAKNAFKGDKKLKTVTIGKNVKTIGAGAFSGCKGLKKINITTKALKKVGKNAFKGINKKAVIKAPSKKLAAYKKLLKGKGQPKTVKIKK